MNPPRSHRLGELLLEMRLVDDATVEQSLEEQRRSGRRLPSILSASTALDEERLAKAIGARLGLEVVALANVRIHPNVLARIPGDVARRFGMLPYAIKRTGGRERLYLVMSDPTDPRAREEAERLSGCELEVMVAADSSIEHAVISHYFGMRAPGRASEPPEPSLEPRPRDATVVDQPLAAIATRTVVDDEDERLDTDRHSLMALREAASEVLPLDELVAKLPPVSRQVPAAFSPLAVELPGSTAPKPSTSPELGPKEPMPLEVPVEWVEGSSPFDGPRPEVVPVGLGETGIFPGSSQSLEPFEPPLPEPLPEDPELRRSLLGTDIPESEAEVAARLFEAEPDEDDDDIAEIEEVQLEPLGEEEEPTADADDASVRAALIGAAAPRAPTPKPRLDLTAHAALVEPAPETPSDSELLVEALEAGASLTSPDRARLVLAIGRLLIKEGIVPRKALIEELEG